MSPLPALALLLALLDPTVGPTVGTGEPAPTCAGEPATLVGTDGDDELVGTPGRDVVVGGAGRDLLRGRGGDDLLCGGEGADRLHGGAGDDTLVDTVTAASGQALVGGPGPDRLELAWRLRADGEVVAAQLVVDLRRGQVTIAPSGGKVTRRIPLGSAREVAMRLSEGTWSAIGTGADERFETHQYLSVRVRAGGGDDVLDGSWHDDQLRGGSGRDTAYPDRGRDTCRSVEQGELQACEVRS